MAKPLKGMFRKGPSWYVRIYTGGQDRWICLGRDLEEACRKYRQIRRGDTPPTRTTVREAAKKWLDVYVKTARNEKNHQLATRRVDMYLKPGLGFRLLSKVSKEDIRRYRLWLEKKKISLQTVSHILSDCRCFFLWCEDAGYIDRSPVPRRLLPRIQEKPPDRLLEEEIKLVSALPYPYGLTARFGLVSGLRWAEMCRAQVKDVRNGVLVVSQTKSGKVRRVPLPADFLAELRGRVGKIVPYSTTSSGSFARDVKTKTGMARFHPHQLRHTFACTWLERGGSLAALQQILGHASIVTTQRYARLTDEVVKREALRVHSVEETVDAVS